MSLEQAALEIGVTAAEMRAWVRGTEDAVIAGGGLPELFTPPRPARPIEIAALAGTEDKTVPWPLVDGTRSRFAAAGYAVTATQVKGGHALQAIGGAARPGRRREPQPLELMPYRFTFPSGAESPCNSANSGLE